MNPASFSLWLLSLIKPITLDHEVKCSVSELDKTVFNIEIPSYFVRSRLIGPGGKNIQAIRTIAKTIGQQHGMRGVTIKVLE